MGNRQSFGTFNYSSNTFNRKENHNLYQTGNVVSQTIKSTKTNQGIRKPGLHFSHDDSKSHSRVARSQSLRGDDTNWSSDFSRSCTTRSSIHSSLERTDRIPYPLSTSNDFQDESQSLGKLPDNSFAISDTTTRTGYDESKSQTKITGKSKLGLERGNADRLQENEQAKCEMHYPAVRLNWEYDCGQKESANETGDNHFEVDQTVDLVSVTSMSPASLGDSSCVQDKSDFPKKFGPFRLGRRYSNCLRLIRGTNETAPKSCLMRLGALRKPVSSHEKKTHQASSKPSIQDRGQQTDGKYSVRISEAGPNSSSTRESTKAEEADTEQTNCTCCTEESLDHVNLLIHSMRSEQKDLRRHYRELFTRQIALSNEVQELHSRFNVSREIGLKLEATNGRYISESLKHKYLMAERTQLQFEIDSRRKALEAKEIERRELQMELDRLQRLKVYSERQYQDALMQANFTTQQLRDVSAKCYDMEQYKDENNQLCKMMYNLQDMAGRIRVIVSLKPTVNESCLTYLNATELTFTPPPTTMEKDSRQFAKIRHCKSSHGENEPVLCRLSHVVSLGSCTPLEIYNELSSTIDGVSNGLQALFVSAGPIQSGKTTTMFGGQIPLNDQSDMINPHTKRWIITWKEKRASLKLMAKFNSHMFIELVHSEEFATCYGLLGLCLLHLAQNVYLKTLASSHEEDVKTSPRSITVSALTVPLMDSLPEVDILANRFVKCFTTNQERLSTNPISIMGEEKSTRIPGQLKEYPINSLSDIVAVCESIQHRLQSRYEVNPAISTEPLDSLHTVSAHAVIIIRVQGASTDEKTTGLFPPNRDDNNGSNVNKNRNGLLLLIDTVGLDSEATTTTGLLPSAYNPAKHQALNAWKDVAALTQMIRVNPNPVWFERNRLLYTIKSYLAQCEIDQNARKSDCCTLLLHLPCDRQQAYTTMQCLRLGLWIMQLNRQQKDRERTNNDSTTEATNTTTISNTVENKNQSLSESRNFRPICLWKIGLIGVENHTEWTRDPLNASRRSLSSIDRTSRWPTPYAVSASGNSTSSSEPTRLLHCKRSNQAKNKLP
ncbi:hypothetical protein FBUS_00626 [Fasciolopsis buskii]|uniref:Uncharacterized protein n=1 Tax=Fasciolopsis buskii TaxID=27845 RepID=A0A8E0VQS0_9TREM|nr:hypothetical protein FBUS_00626 [Fasciolopsis buski]